LAGTSAGALPVVVAAASTTTGRPPVDWRFAADSRLFSLGFRRGTRKGDRHDDASMV
jgi:hypothetical protein